MCLWACTHICTTKDNFMKGNTVIYLEKYFHQKWYIAVERHFGIIIHSGCTPTYSSKRKGAKLYHNEEIMSYGKMYLILLLS